MVENIQYFRDYLLQKLLSAACAGGGFIFIKGGIV